MKRATYDAFDKHKDVDLARDFDLLDILSSNDVARIRQQLCREINCLEGKLDRLKTRDGILNSSTRQTYEDMIVSRKQLLNTL